MANSTVRNIRRAAMSVVVGFAVNASAQSTSVAVHAERAAVEAQRVTINVDQAPLLAVLQLIAQQAGLSPAYKPSVVPAQLRVTMHVREMPAVEALRTALRGTGLVAQVQPSGGMAIVRAEASVAQAGTIVGRVTDAATKRPLVGAKIGLDGADRMTETGADGAFRITGVSAGSHTVSVKLIGYARAIRTITVDDGASVTVEIALSPSATALDQVVVTGTVVQTELRAVPNAITVITAKQIEERGITKIDQLFRGDIPGLFAQNVGSSASALLDEVNMYSRGATALSSISQGTNPILGTTNTIKTYVDGVELADSRYLSQIDPKSIERIEILTGPQASTIYGSNAMNGVMQIFTKRGTTSTPQLTVNLLSGFVQNNFSSALTPQHDYSAQLSGIEGKISYNAGGSWDYIGPWTPAKQLTRAGGFGGVRLEFPTSVGQVSTDLSLRRTLTQSTTRGSTVQTLTSYYETGWYTNVSASGLDSPQRSTLSGQTLGLSLSYVPVSWWSHELVLGSDVSDTELRYTAPGYTSRSDTTLYLEQSHTDRRSLRYATTARIPVASLAQLTVTVGADGWQNLTSSMSVSPHRLTGSLTNVQYVMRQPGHNAGSFLQTQLGMQDRLFLTYGLRAEWNPTFGADAQPNYAPRYGMAYTQEIGPVTAKFRGSYGRSTRPPAPGLTAGWTIADYYNSIGSWSSYSQYFLPYYGGVFDYYLANPNLAPEDQQGGEGGVELYFGRNGSLVVTRYNQTVDNLIAFPVVDSVRTLVPCPPTTCNYFSLDAQGYGYYPQYQYLNLGSIRNQGWELQGSVNTGPFTTKGTYSWTKSRVIGITPRYRPFFTNDPQYQVGAPFRYLPEHTWAVGVTYARARATVGLNVTGIGQTTLRFQNQFYLQNLSSTIRLVQNRFNVSNVGRYISSNAPYALADLNASYRINAYGEAVLQLQNLVDKYVNDYYGGYASLGRQVKAGFRVRTL